MNNREWVSQVIHWEGRFKSQALKDEVALIACMAYVDLNPVRAGIAQNLPESEYTSIQDRISQAKRKGKGKANKQKPGFLAFAEVEKQQSEVAMLPYSFRNYLELIDWQGRCYHPRKRGALAVSEPKLLACFNLRESEWHYLSGLIQRESSTMLDGLLRIEQFKGKRPKSKAA